MVAYETLYFCIAHFLYSRGAITAQKWVPKNTKVGESAIPKDGIGKGVMQTSSQLLETVNNVGSSQKTLKLLENTPYNDKFIERSSQLHQAYKETVKPPQFNIYLRKDNYNQKDKVSNEQMLKRFLSYVVIESQSIDEPDMNSFPMTFGQKLIAQLIYTEVKSFGGSGVKVTLSDDYYVYIDIPSNIKKKVPIFFSNPNSLEPIIL